MKKLKIRWIEIIFVLAIIFIAGMTYLSTLSPFERVNSRDLNGLIFINFAEKGKFNNEHNNLLKDYNQIIIDNNDILYSNLSVAKGIFFMKYLLPKGAVVHAWYRDYYENLHDYLIYYPYKDKNKTKFILGEIYRLKSFPFAIYVQDDLLYMKLDDKTYKIIPKDDELDWEIE